MTFADWIFTVFVLVVIYCLVRICMIRADGALLYGDQDEHGFYYTDEDMATREDDHITVPVEHIRGEMAKRTEEDAHVSLVITQESWFLPRMTDPTIPLDPPPKM